jgi:hypothetical protein
MSEAIQLLAHAERCFRLAKGAVGPRLAEELEGLGYALEREAREREIGIGVPGREDPFTGEPIRDLNQRPAVVILGAG